MVIWSELIRYFIGQRLGCALEPKERVGGDECFARENMSVVEISSQIKCFFNVHSTCPEVLKYNEKINDRGDSLVQLIAFHLEQMRKMDGYMIFYNDAHFPARLKHISNPPLAVNLIGSKDSLLNPQMVGIVGSRKATASALKESFELGQALAEQHSHVVSGGAYGCDIAAHKGVLSSQQPDAAIAVMAGGLDKLFPAFHRSIFSQIVKTGGCILSEKICGFAPKPFSFLVRNRIIAGLSQALVLIQAAERSGALYTAKKALDYGRDILVYQPKNDRDVRFLGNMQLIQDGATAFSS